MYTDAFASVPFGDYERVVQTLVAQGGQALEVRELSRARGVFVHKRAFGAVQIVVLRWIGADADAMERQLRALVKVGRLRPIDLVVVGGDAATRRLLKKVMPTFTRTRVGFVHLADDRQTASQTTSSAHKLLLPFETRSSGVSSDAASWAALLERTAVARQRTAAEVAEARAFSTLVKERKPLATWSIAGLIALVFALELALGGPGSSPVLVRLGALMPARVEAGEWWRMVSGTLLHLGWWHVGLNVYVLLILGTFLERILGSARFVPLYVTAALGGSLASVLLSSADLSVGASGAIWGLLGAHAMLAYRPRGLVPAALIPGAQRAAQLNLGINVAISFIPGIDMWAHFGGGLAGAALLASGLLTRGLPKLGDLERRGDGGAGYPGLSIPTSRASWAAAAVAAAVLIAGPLAAFAEGRPLTLTQSVTYAPRALDALGLSLNLPPELLKQTDPSTERKELSFGDLLVDPMSVSVATAAVPALDEARMAAEAESLKSELETPKGTVALSRPALFEHAGGHGVTASYAWESGLVLERAFLFTKSQLVRVDVMRWTAHPSAAPAGAAQRIVESATPLDP